MKNLLIVASLFGLFGCKYACEIVQPIGISFATTIVDKCVCSNAQQVVADVMNTINSDLVCSASGNASAPVKGPIWNVTCSVAGQLLTGYISGKIPQAWGCTNSQGCVGNVVSLAVGACELIPVPF